MATALQRGYSDPRWMTYKQAADQGWQVRRGEKGTQIHEFWEVKPADKDASPGENAGNANGERSGRDGRDTQLIHRVCTRYSTPNRLMASRNISRSGQLHLKS